MNRADEERPGRRVPVVNRRAVRDGGLLVFGVLAALAVRIPLLPQRSLDYERTLSQWYAFIVANGHFDALRYEFTDYSPTYLYLLAAISSLAPGLHDLFAMKAVNIAFEFPMAYFVGKCVGLRYPHSRTVPIAAGIATLFLPAVIANGALLGQADAVYAAFLPACLYFLLAKRPGPAFAAFGLAFSVKLQAVFLVPLFFWMSLKEKVEWRSPALVPLVYLGTLLPAWFLGRPFAELALFYVGRLDFWRTLSAGAPNPYAWFSSHLFSDEGYALWPLFVLLLFAAFAAVGIAVRRSRTPLGPDLLVTLAVFSAFATPYLLPSMHERYFYPAAVLSVVLAFYRPRFFALPLVLGLFSSGDLTEFLLEGSRIVVSRVGAVALFVLLVFFLRRLLRDLGYRAPWREAGRFLAREARARRAAAAPLLLLLGCLAFSVSSGFGGGRFGRPAAGDAESVRTLTRVTNISAEHGFVPYTRLVLDAGGAVAYERDRRLAPASDYLFRAVTAVFAEDDRPAQLRAARAAAAALFCLAALLAYLSLVRLLGRRSVALGAVLLAFSSFAGGRWDLVAAEGAPALAAVFLAFHGAVVFVGEGGFRRLLLQCAAALTLSFAAAFVLAPFFALGFAFGFTPGSTPGFMPARRIGDSSAAGAPPPPRPGAPLRNPYALAAACCLLFGGAWAGLRAARDAALPVSVSEPGARIVSGGSSREDREDRGEARVGFPDRGGVGGGLREGSGPAFFPYALAGAGLGASRPAALAAFLCFAASVVAAAFSARRRLLLPLALSSLPSLLVVVPGSAVPAPLGASLVFSALLLSALQKFGGGGGNPRCRGDRGLRAVGPSRRRCGGRSGSRRTGRRKGGGDRGGDRRGIRGPGRRRLRRDPTDPAPARRRTRGLRAGRPSRRRPAGSGGGGRLAAGGECPGRTRRAAPAAVHRRGAGDLPGRLDDRGGARRAAPPRRVRDRTRAPAGGPRTADAGEPGVLPVPPRRARRGGLRADRGRGGAGRPGAVRSLPPRRVSPLCARALRRRGPRREVRSAPRPGGGGRPAAVPPAVRLRQPLLPFPPPRPRTGGTLRRPGRAPGLCDPPPGDRPPPGRGRRPLRLANRVHSSRRVPVSAPGPAAVSAESAPKR